MHKRIKHIRLYTGFFTCGFYPIGKLYIKLYIKLYVCICFSSSARHDQAIVAAISWVRRKKTVPGLKIWLRCGVGPRRITVRNFELRIDGDPRKSLTGLDEIPFVQTCWYYECGCLQTLVYREYPETTRPSRSLFHPSWKAQSLRVKIKGALEDGQRQQKSPHGNLALLILSVRIETLIKIIE
jgi:hypothetical protein